jgi:Arc/MetJ-type ribon-helix-helix transcriptional regulator
MPRLTVSIPNDFLTKLDRLAKREHRSRSELLREAARRYPSQPKESATRLSEAAPSRSRQWTAAEVTQYLLDKGVVTRGCTGLDVLVGPVTEPVDMERVLEIGKKLKGLSQQIIDDCEDRV